MVVPTDAELGGDLLAGQHAGGKQAFLEARETRRGSDPLHAHPVEGLPTPVRRPALLTQHFVELHGGVISAESEAPGKGATFRVQLPVFRESPQHAGVA